MRNLSSDLPEEEFISNCRSFPSYYGSIDPKFVISLALQLIQSLLSQKFIVLGLTWSTKGHYSRWA